jgi:hypothetical protein
MLNTNVQFYNSSSNMNALLEAFFCVQANEHVKTWRWHQYTKNFNAEVVDAALRDSLAKLREAR